MIADPELLRSIEGSLPSGSRFLTAEAAARLIDQVSTTYIANPARVWWWDTLKEETNPKVIAYQGDGLDQVREFLGDRDGEHFLVITDDEPPPWPVIAGRPTVLLSLLRAHRAFEYFITDATLSRLLFDTHHNTMVLATTPPRR